MVNLYARLKFCFLIAHLTRGCDLCVRKSLLVGMSFVSRTEYDASREGAEENGEASRGGAEEGADSRLSRASISSVFQMASVFEGLSTSIMEGSRTSLASCKWGRCYHYYQASNVISIYQIIDLISSVILF